MARKLPVLEKVLGAPALFSVAYGEIASSIYFALGIVAAYALGFTPAVLLMAGALFHVVALSYAEGTAMFRETGGAATFVRRTFNDPAGFVTGWALFLDYLIVIALSALFIPHYLSAALGVEALADDPWDVVVSVCVVCGIGAVRLLRRPGIRGYGVGVAVAVLDLGVQVLLVVLGLALLFSPDALTQGTELGVSPSWHDIAFALPLAMLAYTGLETVANLAEEARRPRVDIPRALFGAIGGVVVLYVGIAVVGLSAFPASDGETALGTDWLLAPLIGIVDELGAELPAVVGDVLRVFVGLSGALILLAAATTSVSGFGRLAYSLGEHDMLPRPFGLLSRRTLISPYSILAAVAISTAIIIGFSFRDDEVAFLASLYSFGILVTFAAAQLAVIRLRFKEPNRRRSFRVPLSIRVREADVPLPSVVGLVATVAVWVIAMVTHPGARYAGPAWLLAGLVVYGLTRRARGEGLLENIESPDEQPELAEPVTSRILVPMKLGLIGEEMVATAIRLAQERGSAVEALHVIRVPLDRLLDAESEEEEERRAAESIEEAKALGEDHGVPVTGATVRARSIGEAIVSEATARGADLIVLGSAPRWRRQSRFFSPTVEYVLRRAPCEVLVVAFPQSVLEEDGSAESS